MRLLFKQRFFSWLDSYDVFDESGAAVFRVKGEISFGHKLRIYDAAGQEAGLVKQKVFCWLPQFELYAGGQYIGRIRKKWSFLRPKYLFDCNGWSVEGNFLEWDYQILRQDGTPYSLEEADCIRSLTRYGKNSLKSGAQGLVE